jgi:hypothetical protein
VVGEAGGREEGAGSRARDVDRGAGVSNRLEVFEERAGTYRIYWVNDGDQGGCVGEAKPTRKADHASRDYAAAYDAVAASSGRQRDMVGFFFCRSGEATAAKRRRQLRAEERRDPDARMGHQGCGCWVEGAEGVEAVSDWTPNQRRAAAADLCERAAVALRIPLDPEDGRLRIVDDEILKMARIILHAGSDCPPGIAYGSGLRLCRSDRDAIDAAVAAILAGQHPPDSLAGKLDDATRRGDEDGTYIGDGRSEMARAVLEWIGCKL